MNAENREQRRRDRAFQKMKEDFLWEGGVDGREQRRTNRYAERMRVDFLRKGGVLNDHVEEQIVREAARQAVERTGCMARLIIKVVLLSGLVVLLKLIFGGL